jgi:hypothetical protein
MGYDNQGKRTFLGLSGKGWGIIAAIVAILGAIFYIGKRRKG